MEPRKLVCESCGQKVYRLGINDKGLKICAFCSQEIQEAKLSIDKPEVFIWVGEVAKMGEKLYFNIPKEQKPFFIHKERYSLVVRKIE